MNQLTEMHLLLREAGWTPQILETGDAWIWTKRDQKAPMIGTYKTNGGGAVWQYLPSWPRPVEFERFTYHHSLNLLRKRLAA